ncbi:MAG: DUF6089 family protein [Bacteroidota bacterium]
MNKLLLSTTLLTLFNLNIFSQNIIVETGGSVNASLMGGSNLGMIPGAGGKIVNRINFTETKFVLKNSAGITTYGQKPVKSEYKNKAYDYHWMLDAMLEYNFFEFGGIRYNRSTSFTPYVGAGVNTIYRSTKDYGSRAGSDGLYLTLKSSLGLKYRVNETLIINLEGYLEWDFSDKLDNDNLRHTLEIPSDTPELLRYDHSVHFSIGFTYIIDRRTKMNKHNLPWSDNL